MKHKTLRKNISLFLAMLTIISAISIYTAAAADEIYNYNVTVNTAGSSGPSDNKLSFKFYGENNQESDWITNTCGKNKGESTFSFQSKNLGESIAKIDIKVNGTDGWFPESIKVTCTNNNMNSTLYGGRWIDDNATVTLKPTDNVFKITIKTSSDHLSGTDSDIHLELVDKNGKKQSFKNLHDIHPKSDAFEEGDKMSAFIACSDTFSKIQYVYLTLHEVGTNPDWKIESVTAEQVSGSFKDDKFSVKLDMWLSHCLIGESAAIGRESGKTGIFKVSVYTGDKSGAGTDSFIYCTINGMDGKTKESNILATMGSYHSNHKLYERNYLNEGVLPFSMKNNVTGLGFIQSVTIRLHEKESLTGAICGPWYLDKIEITEVLPDDEIGQTRYFDVHQWFEATDNKTLTFSSTNSKISDVLKDVDYNS